MRSLKILNISIVGLYLLSAPLTADELSMRIGSDSQVSIGDILPDEVKDSESLMMDLTTIDGSSFVLEASFNPKNNGFDPINITISNSDAFVQPALEAMKSIKNASGQAMLDILDVDYGGTWPCLGSKEDLSSMCIFNQILVSLSSDKQIGTENTYESVKNLMLKFDGERLSKM